MSSRLPPPLPVDRSGEDGDLDLPTVYWGLLGAVSAMWIGMAIMFLNDPDSRFGPPLSLWIPFLLAILRFLSILCLFQLHHDDDSAAAAAVGPAGKFALEIAALLAALLAKYLSPSSAGGGDDHTYDVFFCLISVTTQFYVHIKSWYALSDIGLRDVLLAALMQSSIFWIPRDIEWVVEVVCVVLVAHRRCCDNNPNQHRKYTAVAPADDLVV
ncbi:unnamed protein product [Linum trigynum]